MIINVSHRFINVDTKCEVTTANTADRTCVSTAIMRDETNAPVKIV
jgi:hypothetical protein